MKEERQYQILVLYAEIFHGTLIQTVYDTEAAELRMLGYLGYDVITFGNHEYDYRSKGLANMLKAAINSGETVPEIVVCNVDWDAMEKDGLKDGQKQIKEAFEAYGVKIMLWFKRVIRELLWLVYLEKMPWNVRYM